MVIKYFAFIPCDPSNKNAYLLIIYYILRVAENAFPFINVMSVRGFAHTLARDINKGYY